MNSVKTVLVLAVLLAVGYGVYVSINRTSETRTRADMDEGWSGRLDIELPGTASATDQFPFGSAESGSTQAGPSGRNLAIPGPGEPPVGGITTPPSGVRPPLTANQNGDSTIRYPRTYSGPQAAYPQPIERSRDRPAGASEPMDPVAGLGQSIDPGTKAAPFDHMMDVAQSQLDAGRLGEALETLSRLYFYGDPNLDTEQGRRLTELLDQVAGTVIYSRQHLMEQPHIVQSGETLPQIAERYNVPWQLLAKINGVRDPENLRPGRELKVVRGPFNALVNLSKYEMTLMLQGRYAGRFPIGIGRDRQLAEGTYEVKDKTTDPTFYGADQVIDADDPNNPLGDRWMGLGPPGSSAFQAAQIGIHGTNTPQNIGTAGGRGSIFLGDRDIEDVYDILSIRSRVVIRR